VLGNRVPATSWGGLRGWFETVLSAGEQDSCNQLGLVKLLGSIFSSSFHSKSYIGLVHTVLLCCVASTHTVYYVDYI